MATGMGTEPTITRPGRRVWPIILAVVIIAVAIGGVLGYIYFTGTPASATIAGTGATFPAPLITNWTLTYHNLYPSVTVNYNALGSGAGIAVITNQTVDFGASDAPLSDSQLAAAPGVTLFPETLGGVAVTYNLGPGQFSGTLNFTGLVLVQIYNGTITNWSDSKITSLNPGASPALPNLAITTVHRSDGSGTTYAFTNYLSVIDPWWNSHANYGTKVNWPTTPNEQVSPGNSGVAGSVSQIPGAIGYVDVIYAVQRGLGYGAVQNKAGNYIKPNLQSIIWAAGNATVIPTPPSIDLRQHIVNAGGAGSYPIATYTYILVYKEMSTNKHTTQTVAVALAKFLWWIISPTAQAIAPSLIYAQLPANIVSADQTLLRGLTWAGQQIITS